MTLRRSSLLLWMLVLASVVGLARGLFGEAGKGAALLIDAMLLFGFVHTIVRPAPTDKLLRLPLMMFIAWLAIRVVDDNTPSLEVAYLGVRKSLYFFLAIYVGFNARLPAFERIANALLWVMGIQVAFALRQHFAWSDFDDRLVESTAADLYTGMIDGERRGAGLFSSPFSLGMLGAMGIVIATALQGRKRVLAFVLGGLLVWLAMTRINMVAAGGGLATVVLAQRRQVRERMALWVPLLAVAVAGLYAMYATEIGDLVRSDSRLTNRYESYEYVAQQLLESPLRTLFGFGIGSAGDTLGSSFVFGAHVTSHNLMVKVLFETGLVGVALFCWLIVALFRRALRSTAVPPPVCLGLLAVLLVNGATGSAIESFPASLYLALLLGMSAKLAPQRVGAPSELVARHAY